MKVFLMLVSALVLCASCKNNALKTEGNQSDYDSIMLFLTPDPLQPDTALIMKMVGKCDSLISLEKDKNKLYRLYLKKISMLWQIGRVKDAYREQGIAVRLLPENNMQRLEYEALGAYLEKDMDRYSKLIHRAIDECRKHSPSKSSMTLQLAYYYMLLDDDKSAKSVLKDYLDHDEEGASDGNGINDIYNDYQTYKKSILSYRRDMLVEALKSDKEVFQMPVDLGSVEAGTDTVYIE